MTLTKTIMTKKTFFDTNFVFSVCFVTKKFIVANSSLMQTIVAKKAILATIKHYSCKIDIKNHRNLVTNLTHFVTKKMLSNKFSIKKSIK